MPFAVTDVPPSPFTERGGMGLSDMKSERSGDVDEPIRGTTDAFNADDFSALLSSSIASQPENSTCSIQTYAATE